MSALRTSFALRSTVRSNAISARTSGATRSFQSCRVLAAGKESALNQEGRAQEAEHHKQDQLQKQREGKGHWKEELASDSESIVKADRSDFNNSKDTIKELEKETAKLAQDQENERKKSA